MKLWNTLARFRWFVRLPLKLLLFLAVLVAVLFPRPGLLLRQVAHVRQMDSLVQPDLPAMAEINRQLQPFIPANPSPKQEFDAVERFVNRAIKYQYDWYNWGNLDYWPTAGEVWEKKREDCDGRAVLAASILRARGFKTARLVANLNHMWVAVDKEELMGPQAEKNLRRDNGRTILSLPSLKVLLDALAMIKEFPALRSLVLLLAALVLCYHPCRHVGGFFATLALALAGYILLVDWGRLHLEHQVKGLSFELLLSFLLFGFSLAIALLMPRLRPEPAPAAVVAKENTAALSN